MHIVFVTFGNFDGHATLKRATGMAAPLVQAGVRVTLLLENHEVNKEKVLIECPEAEVVWHDRGKGPFTERRGKQDTVSRLSPDVVWICGVGVRNWIHRTRKGQLILGDHSELLSSLKQLPVHRRLWEWICEWMHIFQFDGHICASRYLENVYARRLKRIFRKPFVHYSPYAYTSELVSQDSDNSDINFTEYKGRKVILYMGSFRENYGFWDMLSVFKDLYDERDDFFALFMGRGPEREKGIHWIQDNNIGDRVKILGYIPDQELSSYFRLADAFICPLRDTIQDWARCPSKLYMYLPFRKPVITCPIGDALELFGDQGLFYTPGDREGLNKAVVKVLTEKQTACCVDISQHSWDARAESFLAWVQSSYFETINNN